MCTITSYYTWNSHTLTLYSCNTTQHTHSSIPQPPPHHHSHPITPPLPFSLKNTLIAFPLKHHYSFYHLLNSHPIIFHSTPVKTPLLPFPLKTPLIPLPLWAVGQSCGAANQTTRLSPWNRHSQCQNEGGR